MEKYETVVARIVAVIIDLVVVFPIGVIASFSGSLAASLTHTSFAGNSKIAFLLNNLVSVFSIFYYILMNFHYGQTLGKMAMKIKILDVGERPITFAQAAIRSFPEMFSVFVGASLINMTIRENPDYDALQIFGIILNVGIWIWYIADIIVCLLSEKKRALHDLIAGTVVVKTDV